MIQTALDTSNTEPAKRGLRLLLVLLTALIAAGCATTEKPKEEEPPPLVDRTDETDFRLGTVEQQLRLAEEFEWEGKRALAAATVETAQLTLPEDYERERVYLDIIRATIWVREGEGQDEEKAKDLIKGAESVVSTSGGDMRLSAEIALHGVLRELQRPDLVAAKRLADEVLGRLHSAEAFRRKVEVAADLAQQFGEYDEYAAFDFAGQAYRLADDLDDTELLLTTCLSLGQTLIWDQPSSEGYFREAYGVAHQLSDMGWRNVVIATAVDTYFNASAWEPCVYWGNRIRDIERGRLPSLAASGLYTEDYITMLAQYAVAKHELNQHNNRFEEARDLALKIIADLPENERAEWTEIEEKLRSGLLQPQPD